MTLCDFITSWLWDIAYNSMRADKRSGLAARDKGKRSVVVYKQDHGPEAQD